MITKPIFAHATLITKKISLWRRANARNVSFETLNGGQFTLSTQLITKKIVIYRTVNCSASQWLEKE